MRKLSTRFNSDYLSEQVIYAAHSSTRRDLNLCGKSIHFGRFEHPLKIT